MIYLYLNEKLIKSFYLKKSLLGNYETGFFEKKFSLNIIQDKNIGSVDILASAIKEVLNSMSPTVKKNKEVTLILPLPNFEFLRTEIPVDLASTAITSFISDKMTTLFSIDLSNYYFDYLFATHDNRQEISAYALSKDIVKKYQEVFQLLDLKIVNIIPDTLAYFKLFDKTLRKEKKETILYGIYNQDLFSAYIFDSYGLLKNKKINIPTNKETTVESSLKEIATTYEKEKNKINRLILSGEESEKIRQDTFTKKTGMWTNPIQKIINTFYQDYLKILVVDTKPFPILSFDVCLGAYVFLTENKNFSLTKQIKKFVSFNKKTTDKKLIKKEYLIFIFSFIFSFIFFVLLSKLNINLNFQIPSFIKPQPKVTITPTLAIPTATPTPSYKKEELKIKVLNGGGIAGKATEVKEILKKLGYVDILTGNADNFEYKKTIIQVKTAVADVYDNLKSELKDYTTTISKEDLEASATADIILIIGQDFK